MLICPYCGWEVSPEITTCCGESSMHFIEVCEDCEEETCVCGWYDGKILERKTPSISRSNKKDGLTYDQVNKEFQESLCT